MPESSFRPLAIQGSFSGYSGHQGQTSSQQSTVPRDCFECGDFSHMRRFCPRLRGRLVEQGQQPMITAPVTLPAVQPPRGGGQVGRGRPKGGGQSGGAPSRFYAFPAIPYAEASDAVITGVSRKSLGTPIYVSTPVGDSVVVDQIYQSCIVIFYGYETRADLLLLDMTDFEIILGMDWLSPYHAILDYHAKTVTLAMPELHRLE
ncbi:uncharacterized protein [Nicotiana tomentosiformis]|uniref:uncharacterized protein n=1 Tax=Nicotiana tomentosiformis TaxID=4098 RepID=UPI00388C9CB4